MMIYGQALTVALYDLTAHAEPMREEVERVISLEGWTKGALGKMHKVDSFRRESQRLTALSPGTLWVMDSCHQCTSRAYARNRCLSAGRSV